MPKTNPTLSFAAGLTSLLLAWLTGAPALAQLSLPEQVVRATVLSDANKSELAAFATPLLADLSSDEPAKLQSARSKLIAPLLDPGVSPAFRLELSRLLEPELRKLLSDKRESIVVNALVIAGEIATSDSVAIANSSAKSPSGVVRYQAAYAVARTFEALQASGEALRPDAAAELARGLQARLQSEQDPAVVGALVRAARAATSITKPGFEPVRAPAIESLCRGLASRADLSTDKPLPVQGVDSMMGACVLLREQLGASLPNDTVRSAAEFAGAVLSHTGKVVRKGAMPASDDPAEPLGMRERYAQLAAAAENVVALASSRLSGGSQVRTRDLAQKLRASSKRDDAAFAEDVAAYVGASGVLTKEPFNISPDRFAYR